MDAKVLLVIVAAAILVCSAHAAGDRALDGASAAGLWNVRFETLWQTGSWEPPEGGRMALFQNGSILSGTFAMDPSYSGKVEGSFGQDGFSISSVLAGRPMVALQINGNISGDGMLQGGFVSSSSQGDACRGTFLASLINPDPAFMDLTQASPISDSGSLEQSGQGAESLVEPSELSTPSAVPSGGAGLRSPSSGRSFFDISYNRDTVYPRPVI